MSDLYTLDMGEELWRTLASGPIAVILPQATWLPLLV